MLPRSLQEADAVLPEEDAVSGEVHGQESVGGASASPLLRRLAADIFQAPAAVGDNAEAAALGAAMRSADSSGGWSFEALAETFCRTAETVHPDPGMAEVYDRAMTGFTGLLERQGF